MAALDDSPTLQDLVATLRRRLWIVLGAVLLVPLATIGFSEVMLADDEITWQATHTLILNPNRAAVTGGNRVASEDPSFTVSQVALLVEEGDVADAARDALGEHPGYTVDVDDDPELGTVEITAEGPAPDRAEEVADAYAEATLEVLVADDLSDFTDAVEEQRSRVQDATTALDLLDGQIAFAAAAGEELELSRLQVEREAALAELRAALDSLNSVESSGTPRPLLRTLSAASAGEAPETGFAGLALPAQATVGLLVGLLAGVGLAFLFEALDRRVVDGDDLTDATGLPLLVEVPDGGKAFRRHEILAPPESMITEAYRRLRTILLLEQMDQRDETARCQVVLVASAGPEEGKTTTVAHLARALGERGLRTLAVSADFRRPKLHRFFGLPATEGLAALARGKKVRAADVIQHTQVPNVELLTAGTGSRDTTSLLRFAARLIADAREFYDFVVVDSSPLLSANDALDLVPSSDSVVMVGRSRRLTQPAARRSREMLDRAGANVLGAVLTAVSEQDTYGAYYYAGYYQPDAHDEPEPHTTAAADGGGGHAEPVVAPVVTRQPSRPEPAERFEGAPEPVRTMAPDAPRETGQPAGDEQASVEPAPGPNDERPAGEAEGLSEPDLFDFDRADSPPRT